MVPEDAYKVPTNANGSTILGIWYIADGIEIGSVIWSAYARIQQVENDPCAGIHGVQYISPVSLGAVFFVSISPGEITITLHKSGLLPVLRALKVE